MNSSHGEVQRLESRCLIPSGTMCPSSGDITFPPVTLFFGENAGDDYYPPPELLW